MSIKKVGVVGCGQMGSGIAQVCAASGYDTVVTEIDQGLLDKGLAKIGSFLDRGVQKGKMSEADKKATMSRLKGTVNLEDLADCDIIVEAIVERIDEKIEVFKKLDAACPDHTIFCSNTSSIPIIDMATATGRPDRFIGLHFFNPVPVMKLVEVVRALTTSEETLQTAIAFGDSLGKKAVVAKDGPGFIVNRLLIPYLLDAVRALESGIATKEDIDAAMSLGCNHPMGPLTLADFIGLDTVYYIADLMYDEFKDPKYAAPTMLKQMIAAGYLGRKSGRGFYDYT